MSNNIIDDLPKAPSSGLNFKTPSDDASELSSKLDSLKHKSNLDDFEEAPVENPRATPKQDVPVALMDTHGFETSVNAAKRARSLAAIYTKYAEKGELPPLELLQSDDALFDAIQKTLITRAKSFYDTSREILQSTLTDGDASVLLESNEVTTIDALYEIHESRNK